MNDSEKPRIGEDVPDSLEGLASAINAEHWQFERAVQSSLIHARRAGELLLKAKKDVPHGEWLTWLRENFEGSERRAQTYMQICRKWDKLANTQRVADLSLRRAIAELAEPSQKFPLESAPPPAIEITRARKSEEPIVTTLQVMKKNKQAEEQAEKERRSRVISPFTPLYVDNLITALEEGWADTNDEQLMARLSRLRDLLNELPF